MTKIIDQIVEVNGGWWKIREAKTLSHAMSAISFARVSGSIGSKTTHDNTRCGGTREVVADVVQINSDGTERQPYTMAY